MKTKEKIAKQRQKIEDRLFSITKDLDRKDPKYLEAIQQAEHAFNELDSRQKSLITGRNTSKEAKYKSLISRKRNNSAPGLEDGGSIDAQRQRLQNILSQMRAPMEPKIWRRPL